jgi:hypothetical protein
VGLVARVLEAKGIPTVALSMIPDLTRAVGVPRLAGLSYPMGQPLGRPHDADGQRAVLHATLAVLPSASGPDTYVELPFTWPQSPAQARNASGSRPAPIVELMTPSRGSCPGSIAVGSACVGGRMTERRS